MGMDTRTGGPPKSDVFDLGVLDLDPYDSPDYGNREVVEVEMPYDGYTYRLDASWNKSSYNAIGFQFRVNDEVLLPKNYGTEEDESQYVPGNDTRVPFILIRKVSEGTNIQARIENRAKAQEFDLGLTLQVTNFDPRQLGGGV